jgi:hypothetical protein
MITKTLCLGRYYVLGCDIIIVTLIHPHSHVLPGNASFGSTPCPAGFFCPKGTGYKPNPCPAGTYSSIEGLARASQCLQCPVGKYCSVSNLTSPDGDCAPGFYCRYGVNVYQPIGNETGVGGICPLGHKCSLGSAAPIACEAGTYQVIGFIFPLPF